MTNQRKKGLKTLYAKMLELYDVSAITFSIKEWHLFRRYDYAGAGVLLLLSPLVIVSYPLLAAVQKSRAEHARSSGNVYELKKRPGNGFYVPNAKEDIMQGYYLLSDDFHDHNILPELCAKYMSAGAIVCDIGANMGNHSVFFARYGGAKRVYAFEPVESTFRILQKNIRINQLENVIEPYNVALGAKAGSAKILVRDKNNSGANQITECLRGGG